MHCMRARLPLVGSDLRMHALEADVWPAHEVQVPDKEAAVACPVCPQRA